MAEPFTGEVDRKNLEMSGLSEQEYRQFLGDLNELNESFKSSVADPELLGGGSFVNYAGEPGFLSATADIRERRRGIQDQYAEDFNALVDSYGIPTVVQGTDKVYYLDPGVAFNPYGDDFAGNPNDPFGTRAGMYTRDRRTEGDTQWGDVATQIIGSVIGSVAGGAIGSGLGGAIGGEGIGGAIGQRAGGALGSSFAQGNDYEIPQPDMNEGVEDTPQTLPAELVELYGIDGVLNPDVLADITGAYDITELPGIDIEEPEEDAGGGGSDSGGLDPDMPQDIPSSSPPDTQRDPDAPVQDSERPWVYRGGGVFENPNTGETVEQDVGENDPYTVGERYSRGGDNVTGEDETDTPTTIPWEYVGGGYWRDTETGNVFVNKDRSRPVETTAPSPQPSPGEPDFGPLPPQQGDGGGGSGGTGGGPDFGPLPPPTGTGGGTGGGSGSGEGSGEGRGRGEGGGMITGGAAPASDFEGFQAGVSYNVPMLSRVNIGYRDFLSELFKRQ